MPDDRSNNWMSASSEKLDYVNGVPRLRVKDWANGGETYELTGDQALANSKEMNPNRDSILNNMRYKHDDYRSGYGYALGQRLNKWSQPEYKNFYGRVLDNGTLPGAAIGAGTGLLAGKTLKFILGKLGKNTDSMPLGWIGALGGGTLGGLLGYARTHSPDDMDKFANFEKKAVMYHDPRNFILEKLQGAHDISSMDKLQLASRVRNMSISDAERLKGIVRSAMGAGVGALIARFFLGANIPGMIAAGMIGAVVRGMQAPNTLFRPDYLKTGPQYYSR